EKKETNQVVGCKQPKPSQRHGDFQKQHSRGASADIPDKGSRYEDTLLLHIPAGHQHNTGHGATSEHDGKTEKPGQGAGFAAVAAEPVYNAPYRDRIEDGGGVSLPPELPPFDVLAGICKQRSKLA